MSSGYTERMPRSGSATLSDLATPRLRVACDLRGRDGSYVVARLYRPRGDMRLTDFLAEVTADRPRAGATRIRDRCAAKFVFP
jgi:hypothetical protein